MSDDNTAKYPGVKGTLGIGTRSDNGESAKEAAYEKKGGQ